MGQDFPKMIYHIETEQNKIVKDENEEKSWVLQGWTANYQVFDFVTATNKKLVWHKQEIERLEKLLQNYNYDVNIAPTTSIAVSSTMFQSSKGRGRPRKEG